MTPDRQLTTGTAARVSFERSLALGVEYDRHLFGSSMAGVYAGADFLAEIRDFYLGSPSYNQSVRGSVQNNVVLTGGLLIRF